MPEMNMGEATLKKICLLTLMVLTLLFTSETFVQAETPQNTLTQLISDLQKNPNDNALREKIIRHVQTMRPAPAVPEEAKKYINRGMAAAEDAKNEKDFKDAADEFQKAVNIAPWLGAGYRGLAVTQDKAGHYSQALQNLKLYLLTNPPAADAEAAKTLRDKIEYRMEKAAKTVKLDGEWTGTIDQPEVDKYGKTLTGHDVYRIETDGRNVKIILVSVANLKPYSFFGNKYNQPIGQIVFKLHLDGATLNGTYFQPFSSQLNPAKELAVAGEVTTDSNTIVLQFKEAVTLKDARGTLIEAGQFTILTMKRR